MVKKRGTNKKNLNSFEREIDLEIRDAERWVYARRKFFIKLAWVVLLTLALYLLVRFI